MHTDMDRNSRVKRLDERVRYRRIDNINTDIKEEGMRMWTGSN
jgi:hypothetical protein